MEEMILKAVELGALGIFCLLLLTKGLNSLTALSDSQKALTQAIEKFTDQINSTQKKSRPLSGTFFISEIYVKEEIRTSATLLNPALFDLFIVGKFIFLSFI